MSDEADTPERIRTWLREQGFWLEHWTQAALHGYGFQASLGRVYRDPNSEKLRDIDVLGDPLLTFAPLQLRVAIECKAGKSGAWVVRLTNLRPTDVTTAWIATDRAAKFFEANSDLLRRVFPLQEPSGFAVLVAGKDGAAHAALQQAVSAARGAISLTKGSAFAYPVVVTAAPLYGLTYDDRGEENVSALPWSRVVFSGGNEPILVDVVQHESVRDYLVTLRSEFGELIPAMLQRGWVEDQ